MPDKEVVLSTTEVQHELEWRRCARDQEHFYRTYWNIPTARGRSFLELRPAQKKTLDAWDEHRYTINLKARQIGFTTLAAARSFHKAFFHDDQVVFFLSRRERDAIDIQNMVRYGWQRIPAWMKDRGPKIIKDIEQRMEWANGSIVRSEQSQNDPLRGQTVTCVIVDEWASLDDAEGAWASIEPATDLGGQVIGISTAKGAGNFFERTYQAAKQGLNSFHPVFYPYSAVPERDELWYDTKTRDLSTTPWILHQEYPRNDVECFIKSGMSVFDIEDLQRIKVTPPLLQGFLQGTGDRSSDLIENAQGPLQVWEHPTPMHRYCLGVDVAKGEATGDFSVVWVLDTQNGNCVAKWRGHIAPDLLGSDVIWYLGWRYGAAFAGVEVNNHGLTTLVALSAKGYPNIYFRTSYEDPRQPSSRKMGFYTHEKSKPIIIDNLAKALRTSEPTLFLRDAETIAEMLTYVRNENGKMEGSPHDDQVMALAIANQMREHTFTPEWAEEHDDTGSLDWWFRMAKTGVEKVGKYTVGAHNGR